MCIWSFSISHVTMLNVGMEGGLQSETQDWHLRSSYWAPKIYLDVLFGVLGNTWPMMSIYYVAYEIWYFAFKPTVATRTTAQFLHYTGERLFPVFYDTKNTSNKCWRPQRTLRCCLRYVPPLLFLIITNISEKIHDFLWASCEFKCGLWWTEMR